MLDSGVFSSFSGPLHKCPGSQFSRYAEQPWGVGALEPAESLGWGAPASSSATARPLGLGRWSWGRINAEPLTFGDSCSQPGSPREGGSGGLGVPPPPVLMGPHSDLFYHLQSGRPPISGKKEGAPGSAC